MKDNFKALFINYNVLEFIHIAIKSLRKFHPNCIIYVFDNSDNGTKFENVYDNVIIFDNTQGSYIDFKSIRCGFRKSDNKYHNAGKMHIMSIDKCFDLINDNFLLLDTDIYITRPLDDIIDDDYICVGKTLKAKHSYTLTRFIANMLYINVNKCKEYNIRFYDKKRCGRLNYLGTFYDTSASFYEDITSKNIKFKWVEICLYREHFGDGTRNKDINRFNDWLTRYK